MPARAEEVHHARQEGIDFEMLTAPVEFLSDGKGCLTAARCVRTELGEPDSSGRRRPVPQKGSEFDLPLSDCDWDERQSHCTEHHARSRHEQARLHSGYRRHATHDA
jgi:NADPH-dependent glutamate synthase beta subunit-like oxidoreductase